MLNPATEALIVDTEQPLIQKGGQVGSVDNCVLYGNSEDSTFGSDIDTRTGWTGSMTTCIIY